MTVSFTCADKLSGVATCTDPQTVTDPGKDRPVPGTATDLADNSASDTAKVNIDKTSPTITGAVDRAANGNHWYSDDVKVSFTCADDLSGIASCTAPITLGEGEGKSASGTATDKADNTAATALTGINIDTTSPTITGAPDRAANTAGWYKADVTVHWVCSDSLSGVAWCTPDAVLGEGPNQSVPGMVLDKAGNIANATVAPINVDKTAPTISHTQAPAANANGWNNADVTVKFACTDDLSGIASCTDPQPMTTEGKDQAVAGAAVDKADNGAPDTAKVNIDKTRPTITGTATTAPNANNWYNGPVTIHFTCGDTLSGIASCTADKVLNTNGAGQSASGTAVDKAGNSADATVSGINIDTASPNITVNGVVNGTKYVLGTAPIPTCTATDSGSGVSTGGCNVTVAGGNANGVGLFTYVATATDKAGNASTATGSFKVIYRFDGFLQPINDTAHTICASCQLSVFKGGSTVPAKFQLKKADGTVVQAVALPVWNTPQKGAATTAAVDESVYSDPATSGTSYRWDSAAQQYIYNWSTKGLTAGFYWRIFVTLDDGETYLTNIALR